MESNYRSLFDYDSELIYLNNASTGMLPKRSAQVMIENITNKLSRGEPVIEELFASQADFRTQAARLLNTTSDAITFLKNTTDGLAIALHSIDWQPGDNMIVQEDAFPASLYLAGYCFPKVEKRYIAMLGSKNFYDRLAQTIDNSTRAVVVDYVHFLSGSRFDLRRLRDITLDSNANLIVDGIQGLGAVQIDLQKTPVDFFAAGGVKWLLSPSGTGVLYVNPKILEKLVPFHISWSGAEYEDISSLYPIRPLFKNARRFQPVNENYIGLAGLTESMKMFNEIGPKVIESRIHQLTNQVLIGLNKLSCEILTPSQPENRAGIVTFKHPKIESAKLHQVLMAEKIVCSLREGWVRLAIHFYSAGDELEKVLLKIGEF